MHRSRPPVRHRAGSPEVAVGTDIVTRRQVLAHYGVAAAMEPVRDAAGTLSWVQRLVIRSAP